MRKKGFYCLFITALIVACDPATFQLRPDFSNLGVPDEGYNLRISKQGITVDLKGNQTRYYGSTSGKFSIRIMNVRSDPIRFDQSNLWIKVDGQPVPEASFRLRPHKSIPSFALSKPIESITVNPGESQSFVVEYSFYFNTPSQSMTFVYNLVDDVNMINKISFETPFVF
ncbi:MAG: hypothetical protein O2999_08550 [Nitrospirae bacterium]|nr:hypothetical protein [Nitrospirota bacterium]MDA1304333.1 hypothetical protein [Nitrospirota bacterium]